MLLICREHLLTHRLEHPGDVTELSERVCITRTCAVISGLTKPTSALVKKTLASTAVEAKVFLTNADVGFVKPDMTAQVRVMHTLSLNSVTSPGCSSLWVRRCSLQISSIPNPVSRS